MSVAVAEAMSGMMRPAYVLIIPRSETTAYVGIMRTSTGSMSVTKIIQKKNMRSGKRKKATAKAEMIEMVIFPVAITRAMIGVFVIMRLTGAAFTRSPRPEAQACR